MDGFGRTNTVWLRCLHDWFYDPSDGEDPSQFDWLSLAAVEWILEACASDTKQTSDLVRKLSYRFLRDAIRD